MPLPIDFSIKQLHHWLFDIDGTIAFNNQPVNSGLVDALLQLSTTNDVIFATARPRRDALLVLPKALQSHTLLCTNGALSYHNGELKTQHTINTSVVKDLVECFDEFNTPYILDGAQGFYLSENHHPFFDNTQSTEKTPLLNLAQMFANGVSKIQVFGNQWIDKLQNKATAMGITIYPYHGVDFFDISPSHCCKSKAFELLDIDPIKSIAFGNDSNDIALIQQAAIGICIGNFEPLAKVANYVFATEPEQQIIKLMEEVK